MISDNTFALFSEIIAYIKRTERKHQSLYRAGVRTHPIPFFGSIGTAEVVTVGVNPAVGEFDHNSYPADLHDRELYERLVSYFSSERPPHPWFERWEKALNLLGYSYCRGTAMHFDLSPRATELMRSCDSKGFLRMIEDDIPWFWRLLTLRWENLKGILLAGTVTSERYMDQLLLKLVPPRFHFDPPTTRQLKGRGQVKWFTLSHSTKRLPVFFCSSGPSAGGTVLFERVRQNIRHFRDKGLNRRE